MATDNDNDMKSTAMPNYKKRGDRVGGIGHWMDCVLGPPINIKVIFFHSTKFFVSVQKVINRYKNKTFNSRYELILFQYMYVCICERGPGKDHFNNLTNTLFI